MATAHKVPFMLQVSEGAGQVAAALLAKNCGADAMIYLHAWSAEPELAMALLRKFPNAILGFTGKRTCTHTHTRPRTCTCTHADVRTETHVRIASAPILYVSMINT